MRIRLVRFAVLSVVAVMFIAFLIFWLPRSFMYSDLLRDFVYKRTSIN